MFCARDGLSKRAHFYAKHIQGHMKGIYAILIVNRKS